MIKAIWIILRFTFIAFVINNVALWFLEDYFDSSPYFNNLRTIVPILAFGLAFFINESIKSDGGGFMKNKLSKRTKIIILTILAFFLSKRLRQRVYVIIDEVKQVLL
ncbi:hypothetical protein ACTHHL_04620 [Aeribacillus composti]|uniref:hypothetical protein n=1 Tax=Aeribacillus composti TaxID=1868734 RepID=UPI00406A2E15